MANDAVLWRNTRPFNLLAFPTISIPCGFTDAGMPIGLQLSGSPWQEAQLLQCAQAYEQVTNWHARRPTIHVSPPLTDRIRPPMRILGVAVAALWFGVCLTVRAQSTPSMRWECPSQPIEPCFKHRGRLSSQNGIALKLWLIGTKRVVALDNGAERLPPGIAKYLEVTSPDHSYIYGDFEICPTEPDQPGQMRRVCVVGAEKLVVRDVGGLKPACRIRSTWPGKQSLPLFERWP